MNTETIRIQKLLKRNWDGPMWYGTTIRKTLKDISWEKAFYKPAAFSHNVYEYVKHMSCWRKYVVEYLKGNHTYSVEINSESDWITKYEVSELSWLQALGELEATQTELIEVFEGFTDDRLEETVPGNKYNWYVMLHGLVHHDIYHSAQIAILKKQHHP